jgi:hypothetical protein
MKRLVVVCHHVLTGKRLLPVPLGLLGSFAVIRMSVRLMRGPRVLPEGDQALFRPSFSGSIA